MMEFPPAGGWSRDTRKQFEGNTMSVDLTVGPELRLLHLHFFNICRHHPTLKFKPHATDDERYVSGIDGVPLTHQISTESKSLEFPYIFTADTAHNTYYKAWFVKYKKRY